MAKRYSVVRPSIGGSPGFIPAGGGKARAGRIPKAAEASFSIDLNLAGLRKTRDHQKRVKTLEESGLYEGIDLNLIDPDKVAQLYTKLPSDLAALAKSQHEQKGLRARGSYFQDQADLGSEPPRHFIGSEYERVKGNLDSPAAQELSLESMAEKTTPKDDFDVSDFGPGEYDAIRKDMIREDPFWDFPSTPSDSKKPPESGLGPVPEKNLTRAEEDLANFLGIDPSFVTKDMYTSRTQFQKELEEPDKVIDAFKNTKEVTRYDPETNQTYVKWIKKGTGKVVGKEVNLGVLDPEKGDYTTTFDDDLGKNIITLDRAGNTKKWITIEKDLKEKNWNPQVLLLADFLKDGIMEEMNVQGPFKNLLPQQQKVIMTKAYANARTPAQYVATHQEIIPALREFGKEKGKLEQITELLEAVANLGSNEGNQGNTLRDKHNRLQKR